MQNKVRGILIEESRILLIKRVKNNEAPYWVIPGGHIEIGETPGQALVREFLEETGLEVELRKLEVVKNGEKFYAVKRIGGKFGTGKGPEWQHPDPEVYGTYHLEWIDLEQFTSYNVLPNEVKQYIIKRHT